MSIRFEHVARALYCKPWAIRPEVYQTFHDVFQHHFKAEKINVMGMEVEYKSPKEYEKKDRAAIISASGALGFRMGVMEKACMGGCDYLDIAAAIDKANADPDVDAIVLHITSPGGMVTGLEETAEKIASSAKPVVAYTDDLAASAGYYLGVAASAFFASPSAMVGSIGTVMSWLDVSGAYEKEGIKREVISSGKYKGMMTPGIPITDEQRAHLQDEVDTLAEEFKLHVIASRGDVDPEYMEGQWIFAKEAHAANLIDELGTLDDAIAEALAIYNETETEGE